MLGLSVLWLLSSVPPPLSLFPAHATSFPLHGCCRCSSTSDRRTTTTCWSPFDFQDLKLSPNDLKYPFFLLPHFFFAKTKNQTLKGQSRPAKCNSINKTSWSRSTPNVVVVAFTSLSLSSPSLPPLCPLSPLCSVCLFSGSSRPPFTLGHSRTLPDTPGHSRTRSTGHFGQTHT